MVDMFVMSYLLDCIYLGTKLILVGDTDQLPSVGPGSVLKDIISSEKISTVHLDKIFRQAARSKIIVNAHRVNNGQKFIQKDDSELSENAKEDFFFIKENNQEKILEQVLSLCNGRLKKFGDYDFFENIQVLKSGEVILNASIDEDGEIIKTDVNAAGLEKIAYIPHTKASTAGLYQQGFYALSIENEYLNDITLRIQYKMKLLNNSEADFTGDLAGLYKAEEIVNKAEEYNEYRGHMLQKTGTEYNTSTIKPQIVEYGKYVGRFYYENRIKEEPETYTISDYAEDNSALEDVDIQYEGDKLVTTTVDQLVDYVDIDASPENDSSVANASWITSDLEAEGYNPSLNGLIDKTAYRVVNGKTNIYDEKDRAFITETRSNIVISYNERLQALKQIPTSNGGTSDCESTGRVEYEDNEKTSSKYNSTLTKELKPKNYVGEDSDEFYSEIRLTARKEASSGTDANQMRIDNLAEVLVYSNSTGRRDINSVPGNAMVISTTQGMWKAGYNSIELHKSTASGDWETESKNWTKYPENDAWSPEYVTVIAPTGIAIRTYIKNNIVPLIILAIAMGAMGIVFVIKQKKIQDDEEK